MKSLYFDNRVTTGNIITMVGGLGVGLIFIFGLRSSIDSVRDQAAARTEKVELAQAFMQKQIDAQDRNNTDLRNEIRQSLQRQENRLQEIWDLLAKKEDRQGR